MLGFDDSDGFLDVELDGEFWAATSTDGSSDLNHFSNVQSGSSVSSTSARSSNECAKCMIDLIRDEDSLVCPRCGQVSELVFDVEDLYQNRELYYSAVRNSSVLTITGKGSRGFSKTLAENSSSYPMFRKNASKQELEKLIDYSPTGIPKKIVDEVWDCYEQIAEAGYSYRTENKRGIWAVLIFYISINNDLPRTESEIIKILKITNATFNKSEKKIIGLATENVIQLTTEIDRCDNYIRRHMIILGIDTRFKEFVYDLIRFARIYHLTLKNESKLLSKCIGGIYMLCMRVPKYKHIDKNQISDKCNISTTTFSKFSTIIFNHPEYFKPVFIKHGVPMPKDWRRIQVRL